MSTSKKSAGHDAPAEHILAMSDAEFSRRIEQARPHIQALVDLFPGLLTLTKEARTESQGKFRDGEVDALGTVLNAVEARPALFQSLADKDEGIDPSNIEVPLLRSRLHRIGQLRSLLDELEPFLQKVSDTQLALGELVKPFLLAAHRICKTHAQTDPSLRSIVAKALDFYASIAARAALTRAANKNKTS
jgi:hypothetical protein